MMGVANAGHLENYKYNEFMRFMNHHSGDVRIEDSQQPMTSWADDFEAGAAEAGATAVPLPTDQDADWVRDFAEHKAKQGNQ